MASGCRSLVRGRSGEGGWGFEGPRREAWEPPTGSRGTACRLAGGEPADDPWEARGFVVRDGRDTGEFVVFVGFLA